MHLVASVRALPLSSKANTYSTLEICWFSLRCNAKQVNVAHVIITQHHTILHVVQIDHAFPTYSQGMGGTHPKKVYPC